MITPLEVLKATVEHQARTALMDYEKAHRSTKMKPDLLKDMQEIMELQVVDMVLRKTHGHCVKSANILGVNRNTLRKFMAKYGLNHLQYKLDYRD